MRPNPRNVSACHIVTPVHQVDHLWRGAGAATSVHAATGVRVVKQQIGVQRRAQARHNQPTVTIQCSSKSAKLCSRAAVAQSSDSLSVWSIDRQFSSHVTEINLHLGRRLLNKYRLVLTVNVIVQYCGAVMYDWQGPSF